MSKFNLEYSIFHGSNIKGIRVMEERERVLMRKDKLHPPQVLQIEEFLFNDQNEKI